MLCNPSDRAQLLGKLVNLFAGAAGVFISVPVLAQSELPPIVTSVTPVNNAASNFMPQTLPNSVTPTATGPDLSAIPTTTGTALSPVPTAPATASTAPGLSLVPTTPTPGLSVGSTTIAPALSPIPTTPAPASVVVSTDATTNLVTGTAANNLNSTNRGGITPSADTSRTVTTFPAKRSDPGFIPSNYGVRTPRR